MLIAAVSYGAIGLIEDPLGRNMYFASAFMGVGEMSGILASQALVGQVAESQSRGAIIGVFSMFGAAGILLASFIGGILFDAWRPSAPYLVVAAGDALLAIFAFYVFWSSRRRND